MDARRSISLGSTSLVMLVATLGWAQREETGVRGRLDPDAGSIRLLLGVDDRKTQAWNGRVKLDRGEVLGVEGYRFRKGDRVTGRDGWEARSQLIRKTAPKNTPKATGTGPSTAGPAVTPNGVIVT